MLKFRLNKNRIEEEMVKKNLNLIGLARILGFSRQLTHYALNHGSLSFALKISRALGIEPELIIIPVMKGGDSPRQDLQPILRKEGEVVATAKRVKPAPKTAKPKKAAPKTKKK